MNRIQYLDRAKALGMFFVYYGHFVWNLTFGEAGSPAAAHWRFIYSFHMPLFFFLAGIFWRPDRDLNIVKYLGEKARTRIIPLVVFGLLVIPFWLIVDPRQVALNNLALYLVGFPAINILTWFIVCLFTLEILVGILGKYFIADARYSVLFAVFFFFIGMFVMIPYADWLAQLSGTPKNFWYFNVAFVAMSFYLMGHGFRSFLLWLDESSWFVALILAAFSGIILFTTFNLNRDPLDLNGFHVVVMVAMSFGNPFWFVITAYAGIFFIISLACLMNVNKPIIDLIGRNTMIYLGLNGLTFNFLDAKMVSFLAFKPETHGGVALYSILYVCTVLLIFAPIVFGLRSWFPEFFGYHWEETSLVPPMSRWCRRKASVPSLKS